MERFFKFDKFNTFYDWHCILTSKDATDPEPKTNYIDLDGMNGTLDLTESLTGEVTYNDREIVASFWTDYGNRADREKLLQNIVRSLHGKKIDIIDPDYPDHFCRGRVVITKKVNNLAYAEFTIEAICEPWRYANDETVRVVNVAGNSVDVVINNQGVKTLSPYLTVNGDVVITVNGASSNLNTGTYLMTGIKLKSGANIVNVAGDGSVVFTYREAVL